MSQLQFDYVTISVLNFSARRNWIIDLEIPGCEEEIIEKNRKLGGSETSLALARQRAHCGV